MHVLLIIMRAGSVFTIVKLLGLLYIVMPLRAIDRLRVCMLCSMVNLGTGIDDAAVERLRKIPDAERILEEMIDERAARNYQLAQPRECSSPAMVLEMLRNPER